MKIVHGIAVAQKDSHMSVWVGRSGKIDHNLDLEKRFAGIINPGDTVIDVGALYGDHTVPYARLVGHTGKVLAFEPQDEAYECLLYNCDKYPWVRTFNCALGSEEGTAFINRAKNLGASRIVNNEGGCKEIKVVTLDSFNLERLDYIKIDVEGYEMFVLQGGRETLAKHKPIINMEVSLRMFNYKVTVAMMNEFLTGIGYDSKIQEPKPAKGFAQKDYMLRPRK